MRTTERAIVIRLFAEARELAGRDHVVLESEGTLTIQAVRRLLGAAHPELGALLMRSAVAVNHRLAESDDRVVAGDEVALIPPVAGG